MPYDWAGTRILQRYTSLPDKRRVLGHEDTLVPTDLREWVASGEREEIRRAVQALELPAGRKTGTFDHRARLVWEWAVNRITYVGDPESHKKLDFWQFPAETLALGQGDCEDGAFLTASLLVASGVSPFCVRVVFGTMKTRDELPAEGHVWPIYKDEGGVWRILESTLDANDLPAVWPAADTAARPGARPRYRPDICLNQHHVWRIRETVTDDVASYLAEAGY